MGSAENGGCSASGADFVPISPPPWVFMTPSLRCTKLYQAILGGHQALFPIGGGGNFHIMVCSIQKYLPILFYGLPHPLQLLDNPHNNEIFKSLVKKMVIRYWTNIKEAQEQHSLSYFNPRVHSLTQPLPLWVAAGSIFIVQLDLS